MPKLTKRIVDATQPQDRDFFLWDTELAGFGLRVFPSGRRSYMVQYKADGRTRRVTIGPHGPITTDQARRRALTLLSDIKNGGDPAEEKRSKATSATIRDLSQRYLFEWAHRYKKPRSAEEDVRNIRLHVIPNLGHRLVRDITRQDIERLHWQLRRGRGKDGIQREMPVRANHVILLLSKMFGLAEEWNLRTQGSNPCRGVKKAPVRRRERYLSSQEIQGLAAVLDEAERSDTVPASMIALIRLLMLTGCRLSEILTLQWDSVDLERACLHLPDSKTGPKVVHLNTPAQQVLANIVRDTENPFVITGTKPNTHFVGVQKAWQRIREKAGLQDVRIHDLRHTYASILAGLGEGLPIIGKVLGHSQHSTTARYAHLAADPVKRATERAGEAINAMLAGDEPGTVVTLRKGR